MKAEKKFKDLFVVDNSVSGCMGLRYSERVPKICRMADDELELADAAGSKRHTRGGVMEDVTSAVDPAERIHVFPKCEIKDLPPGALITACDECKVLPSDAGEL